MAKIELEHKFTIPGDIKERLALEGAVFLSTQSFHDVYFDRKPGHVLSLADVWIRRRDDQWQIKYPNRKSIQSNAAEYVETQDPSDIIRIICSTVGSDLEEFRNKEVDYVVTELKLEPFASFTTTRSSYRIHEDVIIDLDQADFGYEIGEVEMVADDSKSLPACLEKIESTMRALRLPFLQKHASKLVAYLSIHNKQLLSLLMEKLGWPGTTK